MSPKLKFCISWVLGLDGQMPTGHPHLAALQRMQISTCPKLDISINAIPPLTVLFSHWMILPSPNNSSLKPWNRLWLLLLPSPPLSVRSTSNIFLKSFPFSLFEVRLTSSFVGRGTPPTPKYLIGELRADYFTSLRLTTFMSLKGKIGKPVYNSVCASMVSPRHS